jgi:hypothetical protein
MDRLGHRQVLNWHGPFVKRKNKTGIVSPEWQCGTLPTRYTARARTQACVVFDDASISTGAVLCTQLVAF